MTSNLNHLFDRDEMIRLSREGLENSMKFFLTLNENVVKIAETQREAINEGTKKNLEMLNKAYEEYQKNSRVVTSRIEQYTRDMIQNVTHQQEHQAGK